MMKTALIAGATGLIGQRCLSQLLANEQYQTVIAIVRKSLQIEHPKLQQHLVDFEKLADFQPQLIADDIYCCLGTTLKTAGSKAAFRRVDYDYVLQLAKLTYQQPTPAKQFLLVSSFGANAKSNNFYLQVKGQIEQAVSEIGFDSVHIFQPSLLLGKRNETRLAENLGQLLAPLYSPLLLGPLAKYRPIEANKVADAMVDIAQQQKSGVNIYPNHYLHRLTQTNK